MAEIRNTSPNESTGAAPGGAGCRIALTPEQVESRGMAWIVGAFLFCPCHLPLTLWLFTTLLAGTALGTALRGHPVVGGTIMTLVWIAATWRGFHLLYSARKYAARVKQRRGLVGESRDRAGSLTR